MWIQVESGNLLNTDHIVMVEKKLTDKYNSKAGYTVVAVLPESRFADIHSFDTEKKCDEFIKSLGNFMHAKGKPSLINTLIKETNKK